jgi:hypothetical protein
LNKTPSLKTHSPARALPSFGLPKTLSSSVNQNCLTFPLCLPSLYPWITPPPLDLEHLITQNEALGWEDSSSQLETIPHKNITTESFALVGKSLAPKAPNPQMVHAHKAWLFAAPLSIEELEPNKYLFTLTKSLYLDHILQQAPWNVPFLS